MKTTFKVTVPSIPAATTLATTIVGVSAAIKTQTDSAMAAAGQRGESVIDVVVVFLKQSVPNSGR